jgi:2-phospho-L-lactate/phosphoenolpyruvate guanylyltransferase
MRTLAILPVKSFVRAKHRLRDGLDPGLRESLAEAMFRDVLAALSGADAVDGVVVVTAGELPGAIAREQGVRVLRDREQGHVAAAMIGVEVALADGYDRALLVPGDCPALDPDELDALLARLVRPPSVLIVPDRHGTGTNALLLTPPSALTPSFGPGSCERHAHLARAAGSHPEVVEVPSLALDVDTPEDLAALVAASDRAPRTQELLSRC